MAAVTKRVKKRSKSLRVLVSAGPTREHVDPVRFLSNESSGRMGFAIAAAAVEAGHSVTLVAGPVDLPTPAGVQRIDVVSAREMDRALRASFSRCDALYMAAAVADWRPARRRAGKWRAKDDGSTQARIDLVRNPDLLLGLTRGRRQPRRTVVAFALETGDGERRARAKMHKKGADWIVLNDPSALGGNSTRVRILGAEGIEFALPTQSKSAVARRLVELLELDG
jgi:phosphopantothenoylcysteine decarboxylase/phosphopantothenate--cysteine ligase